LKVIELKGVVKLKLLNRKNVRQFVHKHRKQINNEAIKVLELRVFEILENCVKTVRQKRINSSDMAVVSNYKGGKPSA
jgi:hypothetical protein